LQNTAGNSIFPDHASQNKKIEFNQADLVKEQEDLEVNLVIPQHENVTQEKAFFWYSLTAIISLLLVFGAFLYFKSKNIFYASELDVLSSQQSMIDQKISTAENNIKEFGSLAVKFNYINQLFDNHIYWSKFFPELEYYTVPGVYYSSLSVSSDLKINLSGRGRNLRALAEELVALRQSPHFYEVTLENMRFDMPLEKEDIGEDPSSIEFSISFYLDGQLINKTIIADK
jgi:Tfp pilus assembly protein PilN